MSSKINVNAKSTKSIAHRDLISYINRISDNSLLIIGARIERFIDDYNDYKLNGGESISSFDMEHSISELAYLAEIIKCYYDEFAYEDSK